MKLSPNATKNESPLSPNGVKNKSLLKDGKPIAGQLIDRAPIEEKISSISVNCENKVPKENQIRGFLWMPKDPEEQNKLAIELVEWVCQGKPYFVEEFPLSKRINPYRFFKTKETNEFFCEAVQIANYICSLNMKEAAINRKIDSSIALAILPTQDGDYRGFIIEKLAKKVVEYIKSQQKFDCAWLTEMKKEIANESPPGSHTDQPVQTQTIPEGLP